MTKRYATTTSYYPTEGRSITMPEGCQSVLFVFGERSLAESMSQGPDVVELHGTEDNAVEYIIARDTGAAVRKR